MAEFCDNCRKRYGFEKEDYPILCEGCGIYFEKRKLFSIFKNLFKRKIK
ncbi:hypothetical protein FLJU110815_20340 [Flavobacterium jumunjinense]